MKVDAGDGRISIPKRLHEKFGDQFQLVDRGDRLVLISVAADPLAALREEARGTDRSVAELKERALDEAGR